MMKRSILLLTFFICAACAASCSKKTATAERPVEAEVAQGDDVSVEDSVPYVAPPSAGVFIRSGDKFGAVASGDPSLLMPTNADRGFGFGMPTGVVVSGPLQDISILSTKLNLSQLQITSYRGIALDSGVWFEDVDDTNAAWLPSDEIESSVRIVDEEAGAAELHANAPVPPGFYIVHDDSFLRSRVADDVSAYYPVIVLASKNKSVWEDEADRCFAAFCDKYPEALPLDGIKDLDVKSLKKCVTAQRVAWKYAGDNPEQPQAFKGRVIYLSRLFDAGDPETRCALVRAMSRDGDDIAARLWKIEQGDLMQRLARLQDMAREGRDLDPRVVRQVIDSYAGPQPETGLPSDGRDDSKAAPLALLSWVPFASVSGDDPALAELFNAILRGDDISRTLVELLGAVHYQNMFAAVQKNKKLATWFKQLEPLVPMDFKSRAAALRFRNEKGGLAIGPVSFEGVPQSEQPSWLATLMTRKNDASSCIPKDYKGPGVTLVLEQPLDGAALGRDAKGVLRDPFDTLRPRPAVPPETVRCILNAFAKIPALPSLDTTQTAKIAVTIAF